MKKFISIFLLITVMTALFTGCFASEPKAENKSAYKSDAIAFNESDLYAAAYLGYNDTADNGYYFETYLNTENLPIFHISSGEYYLIIPRYSEMSLKIFENDLETETQTLLYETLESKPFIIQCNESDIFSNVTISMSDGTNSTEFSPFISLKDGSVQIGDDGIDITKSSRLKNLKKRYI